MESKMKELKLVDLTTKEQIEIDGGSQRMDGKRENWLAALWGKFTAAIV